MFKNSKKILVVDDEKPMTRALELKLLNSNFNVRIVYDGEEAIKALSEEQFDLILLDLIMPKKDGFAVLAEMKEKMINTPVIVLSNLGQKEDIKRAREMGVKNYIIKSDTTLLEIVNQTKKALGIWNSTTQK
jgi:DNA-binding response OmpR family regulator